ncbi:16S rRNA (cytidine(1402)-2'-O)-methyltransferase [candidate division KSB1 bacterium]|nr:16S rRNA (cytidine(1402)-2'-O)-methyltransferase [candidate division KSB1 bacterium]
MGRLYVIATPIGNRDDITLRALQLLKAVDVIAAEDTRTTRKLLAHFDIRKKVISCHSYNENKRIEWILAQLSAGRDIALVSDAGTPAISDPGTVIVEAVSQGGFQVIPVPGASAITAALSISGLKAPQFYFLGFIPRRGLKRNRAILAHAATDTILIFYESPRRTQTLIEDCLRLLGDRPAVLCNDLTKTYEKIMRGTLSSILWALEPEVKGEIILLIGPDENTTEMQRSESCQLSINEQARTLLQQGYSTKDAAKLLMEKFSISRRDAYRELIDIQNSGK